MRHKNGQISAVLGHILIKSPWINSSGSERTFRGGLIKNILKTEGTGLLKHFDSISQWSKSPKIRPKNG